MELYAITEINDANHEYNSCFNFNLAGFVTFSNRAEPSFLSTGFKDWNDATRRFRNHQLPAIHLEAEMKFTAQPIDESLNKTLKQQKKFNREMLKHVVDAIIYLCRQSIPLRDW